jgi:phenylpyruvate tautomerase PptA (4-oxalocrotonate tautomerase family)
VIFSTIENGKHYIGGKAYRSPHLFVNGLIRAGRSTSAKLGLITDIATKVQSIAGIAAEDIWVYIQDIPATQWWSSAVSCLNRVRKKRGARPCPRRSCKTSRRSARSDKSAPVLHPALTCIPASRVADENGSGQLQPFQPKLLTAAERL